MVCDSGVERLGGGFCFLRNDQKNHWFSDDFWETETVSTSFLPWSSYGMFAAKNPCKQTMLVQNWNDVEIVSVSLGIIRKNIGFLMIPGEVETVSALFSYETHVVCLQPCKQATWISRWKNVDTNLFPFKSSENPLFPLGFMMVLGAIGTVSASIPRVIHVAYLRKKDATTL